MSCSSQPIGVFDSGVGGLTVLRELVHLLPQEHFIYFGDTARLPYGNKSPETITRYCVENTLSLIKREIKLLVVACTTASAFALSHLQNTFDFPVIGVIEAGVQKALETTRNHRVGLLATQGTIRSNAHHMAIRQYCLETEVFPVACPLFVSLVEEQWLDHLATRLIIQEYLKTLHPHQVDTVLLGCTHYPFLASAIQKEMGAQVTLIDSSATCAQHVANVLSQKNLLSSAFQGKQEYYVSDDPEKFLRLAKGLFGHQFEHKVQLLID